MKTLNILIVDDDPFNLEIAATILKGEGHRVVIATDGEEAYVLCRQRPEAFDLIVTDILMPRMDGITLSRRLRQELGMQRAAIVCVSAKVSRADFEEGLRAGCDAYLRKPFRRHDLLKVVSRALSIREGISAISGSRPDA